MNAIVGRLLMRSRVILFARLILVRGVFVDWLKKLAFSFIKNQYRAKCRITDEHAYISSELSGTFATTEEILIKASCMDA
jgi:hypothetical protein